MLNSFKDVKTMSFGKLLILKKYFYFCKKIKIKIIILVTYGVFVQFLEDLKG